MTPQEERNKRFDEKFSPEWFTGFGTTTDIDKLGIEGIKSFIQSEVDMALAQFIDQEIKLLEREIELLEKEIDDNDDGLWTGREFADKWLAYLTSLKEQIK